MVKRNKYINTKISIITVVKNGALFIESAINSYKSQNYLNKELIVVYSKSSDETLKILKRLKKKKIINKLIIDNHSKNKYGSLNKGIKASSGDVIGILHADDVYPNTNVLKIIAKSFQKNYDILFGNIFFVNKNNKNKITRIWKESKFYTYKLYLGWMPPHTSTYIKSSILKKFNYSKDYTISADYDLMLFLFKKNYKTFFLDKYLCKMRNGGTSTDLNFLYVKLKEDIKVTIKNFGIFFIFVLLFKRLRKVHQFLILN